MRSDFKQKYTITLWQFHLSKQKAMESAIVMYWSNMYGHTYSKSMDQPGKVTHPARGQLNREK